MIYTNAGIYALLVSNPLRPTPPGPPVLTVTNTPVTFSDPRQPADAVAVQGRPITLTSAAAGSPPLAYQWYFGAAAIPGATDSSYAIAAAAFTNAGAYQVLVANQANSTNSRVATLTVLPDVLPPTIMAIAAGSTRLVVRFSEPLDPVTVANTANYYVTPVGP